MPFIYPRVAALDKSPPVGDHQCVALVKIYAHAPHTAAWRAGAPVIGGPAIVAGTAIATFVDGRYPNHSHGNHAAFYSRPGPDGFWIMDQWVGKRRVTERYIPRRGRNQNGSYNLPSNNADAFFVIEVY